MKPIKIQVTDQDIAAGTKNSCIKCPIALAVSRCTGLVCAVDDRYLVLGATYERRLDKGRGEVIPNEHIKFRLPLMAEWFIANFDRDDPCCQPFEFELTEVVGGFLYESA